MAFLATPACRDGVDNDGDGQIDYPADPGCTSPADWSEQADCSDGIDNDGDGLVDYPADPGCRSPADSTERQDCSDGIDNDGDGLVDHPDDPGCRNATAPREAAQCQDGVDNDGEPGIDFDGGQSIHGACSAGACPPGVSDPEGDGVANPDPDCSAAYRNDERPPLCGLGFELAFAVPLLARLARLRRGRSFPRTDLGARC